MIKIMKEKCAIHIMYSTIDERRSSSATVSNEKGKSEGSAYLLLNLSYDYIARQKLKNSSNNIRGFSMNHCVN